MSKPQTKQYKLDIPCRIEPGQKTNWVIIPIGYFQCGYIHLEGINTNTVFVLGMEINKREQLITAEKIPIPAEFFDGRSYFQFDVCAPSGSIEFQFHNTGKKKAEFFIFLTGKEIT